MQFDEMGLALVWVTFTVDWALIIQASTKLLNLYFHLLTVHNHSKFQPTDLHIRQLQNAFQVLTAYSDLNRGNLPSSFSLFKMTADNKNKSHNCITQPTVLLNSAVSGYATAPFPLCADRKWTLICQFLRLQPDQVQQRCEEGRLVVGAWSELQVHFVVLCTGYKLDLSLKGTPGRRNCLKTKTMCKYFHL